MYFVVVILLPALLALALWLMRGEWRPAPPVRIIRSPSLPPPRPGTDATPAKWFSLIESLDRLGFYDRIPLGDRRAAKQADFEARWPFAHAGAPIALADAEHLCESGAADWLNDHAQDLARRGVTFTLAQDLDGEDDLQTRVDHREFLIRTLEESRGHRRWHAAVEHFLDLVNTLLTEAGSPDRLFWIHGAEDGVVAFLTPEIFAEITRARLIPPPNWPYDG